MLDFFNHENLREGIDIAAHRSEAERAAAALGMCRKLALEMPTLIDDVQNTTGINYSAMPDRLFLVGRDGRIAYRGRRGPDGFEPEELEAAIQSELATIAGASDRPKPPQSLSSSPPAEPHPKLRPTS